MTHPTRAPSVGRRLILGALPAAAVLAACGDVGGEIVVDLEWPIAQLPRAAIGFTATTFADVPGPVVGNPRDLAALGALGAGAVRIHLAPRDGAVVSGARGGDRSIPAERWLRAYGELGLRPTVVVDLDRDAALAVLDAVRPYGVRRFVLGNEMDAHSRADVGDAGYVRRFREIAAAMRRVDPHLEIGGPATAHYEGLNDPLLRGLLDAPPAQRVSFVDFHAYGAGEGETATPESALRYGPWLDALRERVADPSVGLQVGEFNLNWADEPQNNTQAQTVWVATALATILSRGAVAFQYGDRSAAMGLTSDGVPMPSYWGIAMLTGAGLFRGIGTRMVAVHNPDPDVAAFASAADPAVVLAHPGGRERAVRVRLRGYGGGSAHVWRSTAGRPELIVVRPVTDQLELTLPPVSVTTVVLDP
ncbi:hypothetical protein [Pseudonocardia sp.]|uniref:hypothetical protein n=1 Tax=Pseudonocardia sp. TaxID=60912 RepID=UPI003D0D711A